MKSNLFIPNNLIISESDINILFGYLYDNNNNTIVNIPLKPTLLIAVIESIITNLFYSKFLNKINIICKHLQYSVHVYCILAIR